MIDLFLMKGRVLAEVNLGRRARTLETPSHLTTTRQPEILWVLRALDANRDSLIPFKKTENLSLVLQITSVILNLYCRNHRFGKAMASN